jgi:hypothetical protein
MLGRLFRLKALAIGAAALVVAVLVISGMGAIGGQSASISAAAGNQVVNAGDSGSDCPGAVADAAAGATSAPASDIVLTVAKAFADKGYTRASTAGVMGNLQAESSMNPTAASPDNGYGLAQWTPRSKIAAQFAQHGLAGKSDSDPSAQATLLAMTAQSDFNNVFIDQAAGLGLPVSGNSLYATWLTATDPKVAAGAWEAGWERPASISATWDARRTAAEQYYAQIGSVSFPATASAAPAAGAGASAASPAASCGSETSGGAVADNAKVEAYMKQADKYAADDSIGYSQARRAHDPDMDCSSFVWYSMRDGAKFPLGDGWPWTTYSMGSQLATMGFARHDMPSDPAKDLKRGDILLNPAEHVEFYDGDNATVGAHHAHPGGIEDGNPGDQGGEVSIEKPGFYSEFTEYWRYEKG